MVLFIPHLRFLKMRFPGFSRVCEQHRGEIERVKIVENKNVRWNVGCSRLDFIFRWSTGVETVGCSASAKTRMKSQTLLNLHLSHFCLFDVMRLQPLPFLQISRYRSESFNLFGSLPSMINSESDLTEIDPPSRTTDWSDARASHQDTGFHAIAPIAFLCAVTGRSIHVFWIVFGALESFEITTRDWTDAFLI